MPAAVNPADRKEKRRMALVKHQILYEHVGENADTAKTPKELWRGQVDLSEKIWCCASWDNDMRVRVNRYEVREVILPDWLSPEEWIQNKTWWHWLWSFGVDKEWPERWQRGLLTILRRNGEVALHVAIKLLQTKNFRSTFRRDLRDKLVSWLETPEDAREYDTPFSRRQWEALVGPYDAKEAKRISERIYWHAQYNPVG